MNWTGGFISRVISLMDRLRRKEAFGQGALGLTVLYIMRNMFVKSMKIDELLYVLRADGDEEVIAGFVCVFLGVSEPPVSFGKAVLFRPQHAQLPRSWNIIFTLSVCFQDTMSEKPVVVLW